MFGLGSSNIVLILSIIFLFFDVKKLPEFTRGLGKDIRELKDTTQAVKDTLSE